jgi:hypothetical protein
MEAKMTSSEMVSVVTKHTDKLKFQINLEGEIIKVKAEIHIGYILLAIIAISILSLYFSL